MTNERVVRRSSDEAEIEPQRRPPCPTLEVESPAAVEFLRLSMQRLKPRRMDFPLTEEQFRKLSGVIGELDRESRIEQRRGQELLDKEALVGVLQLLMRHALRREKLTVYLDREAAEDLVRNLADPDRAVNRLLDRIAAVVGLTYTSQGDGAPLPDDIALGVIRDLLLAYDQQIIERNRSQATVDY